MHRALACLAVVLAAPAARADDAVIEASAGATALRLDTPQGDDTSAALDLALGFGVHVRPTVALVLRGHEIFGRGGGAVGAIGPQVVWWIAPNLYAAIGPSVARVAGQTHDDAGLRAEAIGLAVDARVGVRVWDLASLAVEALPLFTIGNAGATPATSLSCAGAFGITLGVER